MKLEIGLLADRLSQTHPKYDFNSQSGPRTGLPYQND